MLPFMETKDIKELAYQVMNNEVKGVKLHVLYPFLDNETLDEIVVKLLELKKAKELKMTIPFISKKSVELIFEAVKNDELPDFKQEYLLPFLGHEKIKEMFNDLVKKASEEDEDDEDRVVIIKK